MAYLDDISLRSVDGAKLLEAAEEKRKEEELNAVELLKNLGYKVEKA